MTGTGLLVFADSPWALVLGVAALVLCAVGIFLLATVTPAEE